MTPTAPQDSGEPDEIDQILNILRVRKKHHGVGFNPYAITGKSRVKAAIELLLQETRKSEFDELVGRIGDTFRGRLLPVDLYNLFEKRNKELQSNLKKEAPHE